MLLLVLAADLALVPTFPLSIFAEGLPSFKENSIWAWKCNSLFNNLLATLIKDIRPINSIICYAGRRKSSIQRHQRSSRGSSHVPETMCNELWPLDDIWPLARSCQSLTLPQLYQLTSTYLVRWELILKPYPNKGGSSHVPCWNLNIQAQKAKLLWQTYLV